jgi:glutaminase
MQTHGGSSTEAKVDQPAASPFGVASIVAAAHARHAGNTAGALADYIPELAAVDPEKFGIAVASVDGELFVAGDTEAPFTIQSVSKA